MFDFKNIKNKLKKMFYDSDSDSDSDYIDEVSYVQKKFYNQIPIVVKEIKQPEVKCEKKTPNPQCSNEMRMNHTFTKNDFEKMKQSDETREYVYPTFGRNNYGLTGRRSDYAFRSREKYHTDRTREYFTVQCENELYSSFPSCRNDLMIGGRDNY
jgi:hypothetical protein